MAKTWMGGAAAVLGALLLAPPQTGAAPPVKAGEVLIQRDRWGVPHIYGGSARAVAFGAGYAQAEDHLDRMLRLFLKARGELSRVEGQSALNQDIVPRMLRIGEIVDSLWGGTAPTTKVFYQAFADGINRYMETHAAEKQPWYWKVQARDIAIYGRFTILRNGWGVAAKKLGGGGEDSLEGSNAWAIAASRSASGHAMLLADPHLPWQSDVQWYESHLKCPEFDFAGAGFFGLPVPAIGHNADIGWTGTNNGADIADIYQEKIDPQNPDRYLDSDGEWKLMEKRSDRFDVRQPDGSMKTVERVFRYTRRGPYVDGPKGRACSVAIARWKDLPDPLTGSLRRAAARNLPEFKQALAEYPMDKWHLVYADRQGNVYVVGNGVFPRRDEKLDWRRPLPGWDKDAQWKGILPFVELPQFANPTSGLIVQCNNSVYSSAQPPPLDPAKYPPYVAAPRVDATPGTRAARAYEILNPKAKITWEDHRAAGLDVHAITAGPLVRLLLKALDGEAASDAGLREIRTILKDWDFQATLDNRAVPILNHWVRLASDRNLDETAPPAKALEVLRDTAVEMRKLYGSVSVPMRNVQMVRRGTREIPVPGVGSDRALNPFTSLFMTGAGSYRGGKWYVTGGSSWLMLLEFDTPIRAVTLLPTGESENPASPHFADLTELFSRREPKPFPFTDEQVRQNTERTYRLKM